MRNSVWIKLVMAVFVAGLFFNVSCAKKTIVSEPTSIQSQDQLEKDAQTALDAEAEKIRQQKLQDQMAAEKALLEEKVAAARQRFENQDIHFDFDSSELTAMAKTILKEKAGWLKNNFAAVITIEGHCDERGTTEYNLALGERRATAARSYLVNLGIAGSRINTISYGEERPLDTGKTEAAFQKNRRAHFVIK